MYIRKQEVKVKRSEGVDLKSKEIWSVKMSV